MKKFLLLSLLALFGTAMVRAEITRADLVERVESCEAILQQFVNVRDPIIHRDALKAAKAIVIVNQFKAGIILGVKDGYGVIMVKNNGRWSLPVLINAGEASLGLQLGASAVQSVYIITDTNTPKLLFKQRFNVGVDAKAVAGPKAAQAESFSAEILRTPMLVYTKSAGLYAGATVKAGHLSRDDKANFKLYNTQYTMPELLYSDWVKPVQEVQPLMNLIQSVAP
ncbi:MAG: lipid-binding SYLF domain-containing protein [Verrucomicrobia bacterium]|nr:lipid-binding SYLF domain-containing protein [Verrucomicrobiota bacterium]